MGIKINNLDTLLFLGESEINAAYIGDELVYESGPGPDFFCIKNTSNVENTFYFYKGTVTYAEPLPVLEYSFDKKIWHSLDLNNNESIIIPVDGIVYIRGDNETINYSNLDGHFISIKLSHQANISGNIMSLLDKTCKSKTITSVYCFCYLFRQLYNVDFKNLKLPATTLLAHSCYHGMFYGCTSLTEAPALPATTLTNGCYGQMFYGCTSLTEAPALPATTLINTCYHEMFYGCTYLNTFDFLNVNTIKSQALSRINENVTIRLGTNLNFLDPQFETDYYNTGNNTYNIYYYFEENDIPEFDINNVVGKGSTKGTNTFNIYTNNSSIKDAALVKADQYTIVNVYHLNGTPW